MNDKPTYRPWESRFIQGYLIVTAAVVVGLTVWLW